MFEPPKIYVADAIGTDYIDWKKEQIIALTAPTGSGKTFFILNRLLPFAMSNNRHILYLVNRKALKMQIEEEIAMISHR